MRFLRNVYSHMKERLHGVVVQKTKIQNNKKHLNWVWLSQTEGKPCTMLFFRVDVGLLGCNVVWTCRNMLHDMRIQQCIV
jgi:hypothetical protein